MTEDILLSRAFSFMEEGHRGQTRRDGIRSYSLHPRDVRRRVMMVTDDEEIGFAALFHDLDEHVREGVLPAHPEYGLPAIEKEFGARVAGFVKELTDVFLKKDYPLLNRAKRKQLERERYATFSTEAKLIKLADISSNMADLDPADSGFAHLFLKEKALCLPYLMPAPKDNDLWSAVGVLAIEAAEILEEQKIKFDMRA